MEFPYPCLTLYDFISHNKGRLSEGLARHLMCQLVIACKHMIDHGVYHGDLHMNNILVNTETLKLKVIDLGCGELISACDRQGNKYSGELNFMCGKI